MTHDQPVYVRCPWTDQHTSDSGITETVYFPDGYQNQPAGFRCLHAHCADKHLGEFLDAIGYTLAFAMEGFVDCSTAGDSRVVETLIDGVPTPTVVTTSPVAGPAFDRMPKTGKIKPHANNLRLFLDWLCAQGEGIQFDVFQDEIRMTVPGGGDRAFTDADYTRLQLRAEAGATGFAPLNLDLLRRVVHLVAQSRCYDSAQAWLDALPPWDGTPRIDDFCTRYLGATASPYATAVGRYLWTAMPGRILVPGIQADMAVILVSSQGTGKSSAVRAMAPQRAYYIDLSLSDRDADLARLTRGKTLVELSELRGLHTKEMESIKSFVTRLDSEWVPKYFEMRTVYPRRFIMMGTTNNDEFLGDSTGERRWLPLAVTRQDINAIVRDHAQLWAEGCRLFQSEGILWREAQALAVHEHAQFTMEDVWEDTLHEWLQREEFGKTPATCEFLHMNTILREGLGLVGSEGNRGHQMRAADAMKRLGYRRVAKRLGERTMKVWVKNVSTCDHLENEVETDFSSTPEPLLPLYTTFL